MQNFKGGEPRVGAKWILGIMITVIILTALVPLCPELWITLGNYTGGEMSSVFLWFVNFGIVAAVLCIVLFLLYVLFKRSHKF